MFELMWLYAPLLPLRAAAQLANMLQSLPRWLGFGVGGNSEKADFSAAWWNLALRRIHRSGPVFVKLGQWAATRKDLVPEDWCRALGRLHDKTEPHGLPHTHKVLNAAFPTSKWFQELLIEPEPIGSGCIAQVYVGCLLPEKPSHQQEESPQNTATSSVARIWARFSSLSRVLRPTRGVHAKCSQEPHGGVKVAVKVIHPHVRRAVELDLKVLKGLAWVADHLGLESLGVSLSLRQFADFLSSQADLTIEAKNLHRFRANFGSRGEDTPIVPQVYDKWISQDALVMSYEEGMPLHTLLEASQDDCEISAFKIDAWKQIVDAFWTMVFRHQFVHGDLHPGNVLWRRRSSGCGVQLVFLDCGLAIDLQGDAGNDLTKLVRTLLTQDENKIGWQLIELAQRVGGRPEDVWDANGFAQGIGVLVKRAKSCNFKLAKMNAAALFGQSFILARRHCVRFDARFVNLVVSMAVLQGVALRLNGDGDFLNRVRPFIFYGMVTAARAGTIGRLAPTKCISMSQKLERPNKARGCLCTGIRR